MFSNLIIQKKAFFTKQFKHTKSKTAFRTKNCIEFNVQKPQSLINCKFFILRTLPTDFSDCHMAYVSLPTRNFLPRYKNLSHFFQYKKSKSSFSQRFLHNGHCMGTIDSRMKALHISNKGP